jgi:TPP-dependent pyruvate/acetoin dehydrogenase alpha subunit
VRSIVQNPDFSPKKLTFGQVQCFGYNKSLADELADGLAKEEAIFMYRLMLYNRAFEETIVRLRNGDLVPHEGYKFSGATHLSIGQEGVAVGANAGLKADVSGRWTM